MDTTSLQKAFDLSAPTYDQTRRQLIPCFDDFYGTVLELIPYGPADRFRVLDLGAGTGLLAQLVGERFPQARITLMDIAEGMLAKARERLAGAPERVRFVTADYSAGLEGEFEVVVSALSIHHLPDALKVQLFRRIHGVLTPGGLVINADQVLGASAEIDGVYRDTWLRQVRARGVSETELAAARERMKEDRMAPLASQLEWLRQAGFEAVNCWYQNYSFAVYSGRKG